MKEETFDQWLDREFEEARRKVRRHIDYMECCFRLTLIYKETGIIFFNYPSGKYQGEESDTYW